MVGLLVAIAVGITLAGFIAIVWFVNLDVAREEAVVLDFQAIEAGLRLYQRRVGHLPSDSEGLRSVVAAGNLEKFPVDPWGHEYQYRTVGRGATVVSLGRDGRTGGSGVDADLEHVVASP